MEMVPLPDDSWGTEDVVERVSESLNAVASPLPRYLRCTPMGDGCFTVSTVSSWLCCRTPETVIFDERTGDARYDEVYPTVESRAEFDAVHEAVCRRFAAGEIALRPPPPFGPMWFGAAHDRAAWRLD